ncbi:MAG: 2-polyprenyl-6-hydroxyphenyl methylase/3-demethylubiquinone-9 3-methyltransferase [Rickettsiales bacterium]|jgi:2-polyprenyl-6-hydroxyphenyl methylase/3-demethylubiquinone-9 3-methyltransferase
MSTINQKEIEKFTSMADEWWSETGKFKPLHKFNPCRISYLREKIIDHFSNAASENSSTEQYPLKNLKILDVGCGGGLLCEPLKRLGADIVGIDAGKANIEIAKIHAEKSDLKIDYRSQDVEELSRTDEKFDVVLAMEIIEHVEDVEKFLIAIKSCLKPNGILFVATLNRTAKSYINAIIGAEYILRWLPRGTHDWKKFLKPSEINQIAENNDLKIKDLSGFSYNLLKDQWKRSEDVSINYVLAYELRLND